MKDLRINGPIPYHPQYGGWDVGNGSQLGTTLEESEAFELLGKAIKHYEMMGKAIKVLKEALGVSK